MPENTKTEAVIAQWTLSEPGRKAESLLIENPYDVDAWGVLIREAQNYSIELARNLYERLVTHFPTAGKYWKLYIDQEVTQIGVLGYCLFFIISVYPCPHPVKKNTLLVDYYLTSSVGPDSMKWTGDLAGE